MFKILKNTPTHNSSDWRERQYRRLPSTANILAPPLPQVYPKPTTLKSPSFAFAYPMSTQSHNELFSGRWQRAMKLQDRRTE